MGTKKTIRSTLSEAGVACANCCASLPGPYGTPGVAMARFDNKTLLCSECGVAEALSNANGAIPVSKWFNDNVDSHSLYKHEETSRKFFAATGQLADWPVSGSMKPVRNGPRESGTDTLVCYGWIMARHMARKLVHHESHMIGRGFEFRVCVAALEKGGY